MVAQSSNNMLDQYVRQPSAKVYISEETIGSALEIVKRPHYDDKHTGLSSGQTKEMAFVEDQLG